MHKLIQDHRHQILALAGKHGLEKVRIFGSMARGDATEASDVDLLVAAPEGTSGFALGGLLMDVSKLLGRKVEVVTERALHPALRERILREAVSL